MVDPKRFWDKHAAKYADSPIRNMEAYEHTLERTRDHLTPDMRVLELGCGTGTTALRLADGVAHLTGTDVSPKMIAIAQGKAAGVSNVSFQAGPARDVLTAEVDAVLAFNLLHLLPDAADVVVRAYRNLPPGGLFVSKTVCLAEPSIGLRRFAFAAMIPVMQVMRVAPFVRRFTFAELETMITDAGFDVIETGRFPAMSRYVVARKTN